MQVSAVICTHNRYDICTNAINSLVEQETEAGYEIIVVDNSDDKLAAKSFASRFAAHPINFIHTTTIGLSNARNVGARAATAPIVAYLDDDAGQSPDGSARSARRSISTRRRPASLADPFDRSGWNRDRPG